MHKSGFTSGLPPSALLRPPTRNPKPLPPRPRPRPQALWALAAVKNSAVSARRTAATQIIAAAKKRAGGESTRLFTEMGTLCEQLIRLSMHSSTKKKWGRGRGAGVGSGGAIIHQWFLRHEIMFGVYSAPD